MRTRTRIKAREAKSCVYSTTPRDFTKSMCVCKSRSVGAHRKLERRLAFCVLISLSLTTGSVRTGELRGLSRVGTRSSSKKDPMAHLISAEAGRVRGGGWVFFSFPLGASGDLLLAWWNVMRFPRMIFASLPPPRINFRTGRTS